MTAASPAKERVTWAEVCQHVGFGENLHRTCREKLGKEFTPAGPLGDGEEVDLKALTKKALPVPPPPPDDWKYEPQGLAEHFIYGDLPGKMLIYGGGALLVWILAQHFWFAKPASAK